MTDRYIVDIVIGGITFRHIDNTQEVWFDIVSDTFTGYFAVNVSNEVQGKWFMDKYFSQDTFEVNLYIDEVPNETRFNRFVLRKKDIKRWHYSDPSNNPMISSPPKNEVNRYRLYNTEAKGWYDSLGGWEVELTDNKEEAVIFYGKREAKKVLNGLTEWDPFWKLQLVK